ncbi:MULTISPECIES: HAD family phosphatase [unclassified Kitasatospora]|uniref:HAD family hydrolase n=1 Tax=unclassified Kitasatospora TaxID=2633591 RepID=UPI000B1509E8|nr:MULTISPECIES: HAD-IB family hydrolase [unclassified Kitasatospora]
MLTERRTDTRCDRRGRGRRVATGQAVAFFDVDETLIAAKSMVAFWQHWAPDRPDELVTLLTGPLTRAERNRAYFRLFAGVPADRLRAAGQDWYRSFRTGPDAFLPGSVAALRGHLTAGHRIALVSGSCRELLAPLAEELGAELILCTEPELDRTGRLTGEVAEPMIGEAKAAAVRRTIAALGLRTADCYAYGDDATDLPMLLAVGHPVAVGTDAGLAEQAARAGWRVLGN